MIVCPLTFGVLWAQHLTSRSISQGTPFFPFRNHYFNFFSASLLFFYHGQLDFFSE